MNYEDKKFTCCKLKGFSKLRWVLYDSDGNLQNKLNLFKCENCGSAYILDRKSINFNKLYSTGTYKKKSKNNNFVIDYILNYEDFTIINKLLKLKKYRNDFSILDIGSGSGRFLSNLKKKFIHNSYGLDEYRYDNYGFKNFIIKKNLTDLDNNLKYDVISLIHVLEHVEDSHLYLSKINKLLVDKGILFLEVPNFASLQSKISMGSWFHLDPPRHLSNFTPSKLKDLLIYHDFKIIKIETFSFKLGLYGMLQSLLNLIGFKKQLLYLTLRKINISTNRLQILLMLSVLPLLIPIAIALEIVAAIFKHGGIIRVYARKDL